MGREHIKAFHRPLVLKLTISFKGTTLSSLRHEIRDKKLHIHREVSTKGAYQNETFHQIIDQKGKLSFRAHFDSDCQ